MITYLHTNQRLYLSLLAELSGEQEAEGGRRSGEWCSTRYTRIQDLVSGRRYCILFCASRTIGMKVEDIYCGILYELENYAEYIELCLWT